MTTLPTPLRESLREPFTDGDLAPLWARVEGRRARRSAARIWAPITVATAAALALVVARGHRPAPVGPLHLSNGAAVPVLDSDRAERAVALDDRSRLTLSAGAHLEPRRNDARAFDTALARGRVRFDVRPRGPRAWSIDCGLAVVRVVGTSFALERSPERLHIEVFHGLVRVEGERVPGHARLLAAGETLDVTAADVPPANEPTLPAAPAAPERPAPRPLRVARPEPWRALAARREFGAAYDALGPGGAESRARTASADDLLALGEVAHRSHHYAEAAGLYERFVGEHADHPEAAMVGFTLGRLQLDQLAAPRDAAHTLDRARRGAVPRYLLEDVLARLVEARARSGDVAGARAAAEEYGRTFSGGRRAVDVRRWSE